MTDLLKELQQFVKRGRKLKHWNSSRGICSNTSGLQTNHLDFTDYLEIAYECGLVNDYIAPCNQKDDYLYHVLNNSFYKGAQRRKRLRLVRKIIKLIRQKKYLNL